MSAARWRRAMNSAAAGTARSPLPRELRPAMPAATPGSNASADVSRGLRSLVRAIRLRHVIVLAAALLYPAAASPFFTFQIGAQALALGLIALSLTFLGGYGGMVSLAQMTVAGLAGYLVAIFGSSSMPTISLGWPWWLAVTFALALATPFATPIGWP